MTDPVPPPGAPDVIEIEGLNLRTVIGIFDFQGEEEIAHLLIEYVDLVKISEESHCITVHALTEVELMLNPPRTVSWAAAFR